jgi:hypothetical protein
MKTQDTIQNMASIVESIIDVAKESDYETAMSLEMEYKDLNKALLQSVETMPQMLDALLRLTRPMAGDDDLEFALATIENAQKENQ